LVGFLVLLLTNYHPKIRPSLVSKVTTDFQIATVLLVLMARYYSIFQQLSTVAIYGTALFTILSGSHYVYVGMRTLNEKKN
jgi:cardiolipin synthase